VFPFGSGLTVDFGKWASSIGFENNYSKDQANYSRSYEYKISDGLLMRDEWRRDFSSIPFFLTRDSGVFKSDQNTATVAAIWWWGTKRGVW